MLKIKYDRSNRTWVATLNDANGQLGEAMVDQSRDSAMFWLGLEYGQYPSKFARPMSKYFDEVEAKA